MKKALLIIDLQKDYFPGGLYPLWDTGRVLENIVSAIGLAQKQGIEVIQIQHIANPDLGLSPEACLFEGRLDPCSIVIFGATGNLTATKLMPALYNLFLRGGLPVPCCLVGCARTPLSHQEFQERMADAVQQAGLDVSRWQEFASTLHYLPLDYASPSDYESLARFLQDLEDQQQTQGNRLFYLAVPPSLYAVVSQGLGRSGLSAAGERGRAPRI